MKDKPHALASPRERSIHIALDIEATHANEIRVRCPPFLLHQKKFCVQISPFVRQRLTKLPDAPM
jgi:hypothetical protein